MQVPAGHAGTHGQVTPDSDIQVVVPGPQHGLFGMPR